MGMRLIKAASMGMAVLGALGSTVAVAQTVPTQASEVARPGGKLPGDPKIALVKLADGFNDPVGVASAIRRHGTHLRRRARRQDQDRQGRQGRGEAIPRPHQEQPAGHRGADRLRRAGPVGRRVRSEVQGQRLLLRSYASLPFNGAQSSPATPSIRRARTK